MDAALLQMFAQAADSRLAGLGVGPVRWLRPLLSVPVGDRRRPRFLVVILETPGPFCFLSDANPLGGVDGSVRFGQLAGSVVRTVRRRDGERILELIAGTNDEIGGELTLRLLLFGSSGRAELARGDAVLQHVGGHLRPGGDNRPVAAPVPPVTGPFYLISKNRPGRVKPAAREDPGATHRYGPFDDPVAACRAVGDALLEEARRRIVKTGLKPFTRRLETRRKLLVTLEAQLKQTENHERIRREAETLAAYQSRIRQGQSSVELPDVYDPDGCLTIDLDPALPVGAQVEKRFRKAAKLERSIRHTHRRIEEVTSEVDSLKDGIESVETARSFEDAMGRLASLLRETPGVNGTGARKPPGEKAAAHPTGRRIELDDMWFVLVGRNNRENDHLTFHEAAPTDLWFHAQHVPGSHVVLKSRGHAGSPPSRVVEQTASIAAFYSKARHSGLVPVIYTLRKYVRKPRGAKPGQVVCEREKMVMVEPVLPPGTSTGR